MLYYGKIIVGIRQTYNGRRLALQSEGTFPSGKEGCRMVTYEAMFLFGSLIVSIIALVVSITKKK